MKIFLVIMIAVLMSGCTFRVGGQSKPYYNDWIIDPLNKQPDGFIVVEF
jgi:hypothetical protein